MTSTTKHTYLDHTRRQALKALRKYADACHENETMFTGWGEGIVPKGATDMRIEAEEIIKKLEART